MVLRDPFWLVLAGAAIGTLAALVAGRYVEGQLFGVTRGDPTALAAATLLLATTAIAAYLPARRASRIDPMIALRWE